MGRPTTTIKMLKQILRNQQILLEQHLSAWEGYNKKLNKAIKQTKGFLKEVITKD